MAKFDVSKFSKDAVGMAREAAQPHVRQAIKDVKSARDALEDVEKDIEATLKALEAETDSARAAMLIHDLERTLPARKAAIRSTLRSTVANDVVAGLEAALDVAVRVALVAAKAFLSGI